VSIVWGPERVQLYNDAYVPIAAERHPAALGRRAAENWSEAYEPFLGPVFDRVFAGETVTLDEHAVPLLTPNGRVEERFFTGSFQPVRDESGSVGGVFHPLIEVTAKVQADAERRERDARLRRILDGMDEGFGVLGPDFTILEQNSEALRLDGRPREEIVGRSHWEVYPGSEDSELGRLYKRAMAERVSASLEHCYAFENGRARWLDMRASPTADGRARRVLARCH
jgi:PAS domain S-box-containing protein